jgi:hypothetical protein
MSNISGIADLRDAELRLHPDEEMHVGGITDQTRVN